MWHEIHEHFRRMLTMGGAGRKSSPCCYRASAVTLEGRRDYHIEDANLCVEDGRSSVCACQVIAVAVMLALWLSWCQCRVKYEPRRKMVSDIGFPYCSHIRRRIKTPAALARHLGTSRNGSGTKRQLVTASAIPMLSSARTTRRDDGFQKRRIRASLRCSAGNRLYAT